MEKGYEDEKSIFYSQQSHGIFHDASTSMLLLLLLIALAIAYVLNFLKIHVKPTTKLPPGTSGWPFLGETIEFIVQEREFFRRRRTKYGHIFRTHLMGSPFVILCGSTHVKQLAKYGNDSVSSTTSPSMALILNRGSYISNGEAHEKAARTSRKAISSDSVTKFCDTARGIIRQHIKEWCEKDQIIANDEIKRLQAHLASCYLIGIDKKDATEAIFDVSELFEKSLFSLPIDLPGFTLHEAIQKREEIIELIKEAYRTSKSDSVMTRLLDQEDENEEKVDDVAYRILEMLWAGVSTSASVMITILYQLSKREDVVQRLYDELVSTDDNRKSVTGRAEPGVNLFESVVKEGLRFMPPVMGVFRKTNRPIEIGGYTIPENWGVLVSVTDTHETSATFDNVYEFDISRWERNSKPLMNEFIPFCPNRRLCPGNEYAMKTMSIFVKEIVSMCKWRMVNSGSVKYSMTPFPFPKDGLPLRFFKRDASDSL